MLRIRQLSYKDRCLWRGGATTLVSQVTLTERQARMEMMILSDCLRTGQLVLLPKGR